MVILACISPARLEDIIDGEKVTRDKFFDTMNAWGKDPEKKFVVLHHSILSEGINVNGLEAVLFMRNMDYIGISQSIGRVIRLGGAEKTFGLVCVPVYDRVGLGTARSVQAVVDCVFEQGEPVHLHGAPLMLSDSIYDLAIETARSSPSKKQVGAIFAQ